MYVSITLVSKIAEMRKPRLLTDENGVYRYKFVDGKITERSAEEMAADIPEPAETPPTNAELAQQITDVQMALCEIYESLF